MENQSNDQSQSPGSERVSRPLYDMDSLMLGTDIRKPDELQQIRYSDLTDYLADDYFAKIIAEIRTETDPEKRKQMKLELPYIVGGIFDGSRKNERMVEMHYMIFDFDLKEVSGRSAFTNRHSVGGRNPGLATVGAAEKDKTGSTGSLIAPQRGLPASGTTDKEDLQAKRSYVKYIKEKLLPALDFVQLGFESPNHGLKLVVPFSYPVFSEDDYRLIYNYYLRRCEEVLKLKADATCDPARACFLSSDPDYYENPRVNKVSPETALQLAIAENVAQLSKEKTGLSAITNRHPREGGDPESATVGAAQKEKTAWVPACAGTTEGAGTTEEITPQTYQDIASAVEYCALQKLSYADWVAIGMALKSALGEEGKALWDKFLNNPHFPKEKQITLDRHWASFDRVPPGRNKVTYRSIFHVAHKYGWQTDNNPPHSNNRHSREGGNPGSATVGAINKNSMDPCLRRGDDGKKLSDFPELMELFGKHVNVPLDESRLPAFMQEYLNITGEITDAQAGARLTALLPVIATNIGNRIYMYNAGTQHFCNIWAAIIGPSTISRKTTVISLALKTVKLFQDSLKGLSPKERNEQDITLTRVTQARLFNLLAVNPNRLILQMELAAWMQEMNKTYNAGMKQDLTNMFDGRDMSIAKMEIDEHISKPAFSILGATTEDWFFRELREVADQRGGFLQRFIICMIQNIDLETLNFNFRDCDVHDDRLLKLDEIFAVFRNLPGNFRLRADDEAVKYRDEAYAERMKASALTGNDPMAAYCSRMYDNYWFRFCIIIWAMQHWREIQSVSECHAELG